MTALFAWLENRAGLRHAAGLRTLLGHRILNGLSVAVGVGSLSVIVYLLTSPIITASASVGMLILSIGDQTAPARGKLRQIAPLLWLAAPLTLAVQLAHLAPQHAQGLIGAIVCVGGFVGMLGNAWGVRGAPMGFALLLAVVFAMSTPPPPDWRAALTHVAWFQLGALLYAAYAMLSAKVLNTRYRTQAVAEAFGELAAMLKQQGARLAATADRRESRLQGLLSEQAVLADKLQIARDLVLDQPASTRELRLVAMLIAAIRLREHALALELDLEMQSVRSHPALNLLQAQTLESFWRELAERLDRVCWALFVGGGVHAAQAPGLDPPVDIDAAGFPDSLRHTFVDMSAELGTLVRMADALHPAAPPDLAAQALDWPRFRSSMRWPIAPLKRALAGSSPVLRYAVRVTIALGAGYAVSLHLPWATHPHWILLTIAVVMRSNIAQTLERRNARLAGTLLGCVLVTALLSLHPDAPVQYLVLALAIGVAHGFAQVRYLVAATAATVLALIQGQLLHTADEFALVERLADTVIGTAMAWAFSYVLPAWERRQLPALLERLRLAQVQHAQVALGDVDLASANADWRLARREVHDSLAAIANAAQRALAEPRGVRPPLQLLERVQLRSYRLLAQLGGLRTWREQPQAVTTDAAAALLAETLSQIDAALTPGGSAPDEPSGPSPIEASATASGPAAAPLVAALPVTVVTETVTSHELTAALRRRLRDAVDEAAALGADIRAARRVEAAHSA